MKHIFFPLCLFALSSLPATTYTKKLTSHDARMALQDASATDAQLLLNLVYWSCLRSKTTTLVQDIIFDQLQQSWQLWMNSSTLRRNPRTALPYPDVTSINSDDANFAAQVQTFVNASYINILACTAEKDSLISSREVKKYIAAFRSEARSSVVETIITSLTNLESTLENVHAMLETFNSKRFIHNLQLLNKELDMSVENRIAEKNLLDDGISYMVNGLALDAFAQFDKKYLTTSTHFFDILADSQTMYMQVWQQLEYARAAYYQELYGTIYNSMVELNFPASSFLIAIDADGFIAPDSQTEPLPAVIL